MKILHKKISIALILIANIGFNIFAQNKSITYTGDTVTMFANPERGWYDSYSPDCCDKIGATCSATPLEMHPPHDLLTFSNLQAMLNTPEKMTLYQGKRI